MGGLVKKILFLMLVLAAVFVVFMRVVYVEPSGFPDRSGEPIYDDSALELVANLKYPPANIAVNKQGRVFVTLHPEAKPPSNFGEIVNGNFIDWTEIISKMGVEPFSDAYGVRFDQKGHLWVLDNYPARLIAIDIESKSLIQEYHFNSEAFPFLSHANDFQVSSDGNFIYITDDGLFNRMPALVVYDAQSKKAWRHLESDVSVNAGNFAPVVQGVEMTKLGLFSINPGVDGLALSRDDKWLYFASFSSDKMYRVDTQYLQNSELDVSEYVEIAGDKTFTDGMTTDLEGRVYLSDIEHSAIVRWDLNQGLETLVKSDKLRWPDGFSFDSHGNLYVTCSALHQVILKTSGDIQRQSPFQVYKMKITEQSVAGH